MEYWGCQPYQLSYRSWMEGSVDPSKDGPELRRDFSERFTHQFHRIENGRGPMETKHFLGRTTEEEHLWQAAQRKRGIFIHPPVKEATMDDLNPPATFLVSLDAPADGFATNAKDFFGAGGVSHPTGLTRKLDQDLNAHGAESAFLLERRISLDPGQSRTMYFLYGYLPKGTDLHPLVEKYRNNPSTLWASSSEKWKRSGLRLSTASEPWVERETTWSYYYLRSGLTYDEFFQEHILSQGGIWQYMEGFQGAARDPLQQGLPFIFSDPKFMREILRYTLKEVRPDGTIPYGMTGSGIPLPVHEDDSSDLALWLLWAAGEYVLATRDTAFFDEEVTTYPISASPSRKQSIRNLLAQCYRHTVTKVGTGQHKLMRMLMDDWADGLVRSAVPENMRSDYVRVGESVLNSAMASYVFDYYAQMLTYAGGDPRWPSTPARRQRKTYS